MHNRLNEGKEQLDCYGNNFLDFQENAFLSLPDIANDKQNVTTKKIKLKVKKMESNGKEFYVNMNDRGVFYTVENYKKYKDSKNISDLRPLNSEQLADALGVGR